MNSPDIELSIAACLWVILFIFLKDTLSLIEIAKAPKKKNTWLVIPVEIVPPAAFCSRQPFLTHTHAARNGNFWLVVKFKSSVNELSWLLIGYSLLFSQSGLQVSFLTQLLTLLQLKSFPPAGSHEVVHLFLGD